MRWIIGANNVQSPAYGAGGIIMDLQDHNRLRSNGDIGLKTPAYVGGNTEQVTNFSDGDISVLTGDLLVLVAQGDNTLGAATGWTFLINQTLNASYAGQARYMSVAYRRAEADNDCSTDFSGFSDHALVMGAFRDVGIGQIEYVDAYTSNLPAVSLTSTASGFCFTAGFFGNTGLNPVLPTGYSGVASTVEYAGNIVRAAKKDTSGQSSEDPDSFTGAGALGGITLVLY